MAEVAQSLYFQAECIAVAAILRLNPRDFLDDSPWLLLCVGAVMPNPNYCVYVLRCLRDRSRYYTGVTSDLRRRLARHNRGGSPHTATGTPWEIDVQFTDERRALAFERYLKSGSGAACETTCSPSM